MTSNGSGSTPPPIPPFGSPQGSGPEPDYGEGEDLLLDLGKMLSDEPGSVGPFRSWQSLYLTVVVYALVTLAVLYAFTLALDFSPS
jgi:hypothetical protein